MEIKISYKRNTEYNIKRLILSISLFINSLVLLAQSNDCCNSKSELATYLVGYWKVSTSDSVSYSYISFKNNDGRYYKVESIKERKLNKDYANLEIRKEDDLWYLGLIMKFGGVENAIIINNSNKFTWRNAKYERVKE